MVFCLASVCVCVSICNHVSMCIMKKRRVLFCYRVNAINRAPQRGTVAGLCVPLGWVSIMPGEKSSSSLPVSSWCEAAIQNGNLIYHHWPMLSLFYPLTHTHRYTANKRMKEKFLEERKERDGWGKWEEGKRGQRAADARPLLRPPNIYKHTSMHTHSLTQSNSLLRSQLLIKNKL